MTATAAREDLRSGLLAPGKSPADLAWAHLLDEAARNVRRTGDRELHAAVAEVRRATR